MQKRIASCLLLALALLFSVLSVALAEQGEPRQWFTVEALNAGLGEAPDEVRRKTPREAVRSFMALTEEGDFAAAAHLLDLSDLAPEEQAERGAKLARQLAEVLRRGEWLNVSNLPAREDALVEDATGQHPRTGQPRRNLPLVTLDAKGQTYDIRIVRSRMGEADPVWLITPESSAAVGLLYEEYGPSWLEQYIPERFHATYGMLKLWEWIAIPLFVTILGLLGWAVFVTVGVVARWLPAGVSTIFTGNIRMPLAFIAMSMVAQILLDYVVSFSGAATASFRVLLIVILAWGVGLVALRLLDAFLTGMTRRLVGEIDDTRHRDERKLLTSLYALRRGIILITVAAVMVYILAQVDLFGTLGLSLLASASVLTKRRDKPRHFRPRKDSADAEGVL